MPDRSLTVTARFLDSIANYRVYTKAMSASPNHAPGGKLLKIGEVAKASGAGVETLRFYESRGLIEPAMRTESGYRLYAGSVLDRLAFIKKSQAVGFTLDQIAWLIAEAKEGRRPCAEVRRMAQQRLLELDERLKELKRYRRELKQTVDAWEDQGEKEGAVCGLIEGLAAGSIHPPKERSMRAPKRAKRRSR